jgi:hypothetical protein
VNAWLFAVLLAAANPSEALPAPPDATAEAIMSRIEGAEPDVASYRAGVEFTVGLHSFPFLRKTLHGETYFKRPDRLELVFDDLPPFARQFRSVYVGLGTPPVWRTKFDITVAGEGPLDQHLVLTPKKRTGRLRDVAVYLDAASSLPARMVWTYRDGKIEMLQTIGPVEGHYVVLEQHGEIRLPGVSAFIRSRLHDYLFNVSIDDAIFTKTPSPSA